MTLTKILIFMVIFLGLVPVMTLAACLFPRLRHVYFAAILYFTVKEYAIHLHSIPTWTGTARGYAFTAVSLFAFPLLLSMVFSFRYKVRFFPPGAFFYGLYFLANFVSCRNAVEIPQWGFEICKMVWMYVTFLAVFNFLNKCRDLSFLFYEISCILIMLFLVGLNQKYRLGHFQVSTTFPHPNSLSLYLESFALPTLGVLMNERISKWLLLFTAFAFCGSVVLIVLTYSRGGLVVFFGGIAIVCALSILINGFSIRRLNLLLIGLTVLLCIVGYALPRIILRFTKAPEASKNTRIELAYAARAMANDYTLGVGANNYSVHSARYWNKFKTNPVEHGGIVETIYLLVAAECGWWGLGCLLLWFFYYYLSAGFSMFYLRKMPCCGIMIGVFAGLTCNYWHSTLEWSLKQPNNFSGQMIVYAIIAVVAVHRKKIRQAYKLEQKEAESAMKLRPPALPRPVRRPAIASVPVSVPAEIPGDAVVVAGPDDKAPL